jgi:hypothetical protein
LPSSVDPLTRIRKVTLDVLSALRLLEEQHRLQEEEPETSKEESTVPATSLDPITESPRSSLDSSRSETLEDRRPWEDRLGHLYHSNVTPSDSRSLQAVRKEVERYLREVNVVLFDGQGWSASDRAPANRRRGSQRHDAFSTLGIEEEAKGSLDIPLGSWMNKGLDLQGEFSRPGLIERNSRLILAPFTTERISDLISSLDIPRTSGSGSHLATPTKSSDGLRFLTDGQVLCQAYNRVVRRSRRPFGFIPEHKIHDFGTDQRPPSVALSPESIERRQSVEGESKQPRDYAFRRIENMREFAAVSPSLPLRLRSSTSLTLSCCASLYPPGSQTTLSRPHRPARHFQPSTQLRRLQRPAGGQAGPWVGENAGGDFALLAESFDGRGRPGGTEAACRVGGVNEGREPHTSLLPFAFCHLTSR